MIQAVTEAINAEIENKEVAAIARCRAEAALKTEQLSTIQATTMGLAAAAAGMR